MIVLRHSRVTFPIKVIFLAALSLYFLSMFISILVNRDFILPEALVNDTADYDVPLQDAQVSAHHHDRFSPDQSAGAVAAG